MAAAAPEKTPAPDSPPTPWAENSTWLTEIPGGEKTGPFWAYANIEARWKRWLLIVASAFAGLFLVAIGGTPAIVIGFVFIAAFAFFVAHSSGLVELLWQWRAMKNNPNDPEHQDIHKKIYIYGRLAIVALVFAFSLISVIAAPVTMGLAASGMAETIVLSLFSMALWVGVACLASIAFVGALQLLVTAFYPAGRGKSALEAAAAADVDCDKILGAKASKTGTVKHTWFVKTTGTYSHTTDYVLTPTIAALPASSTAQVPDSKVSAESKSVEPPIGDERVDKEIRAMFSSEIAKMHAKKNHSVDAMWDRFVWNKQPILDKTIAQFVAAQPKDFALLFGQHADKPPMVVNDTTFSIRKVKFFSTADTNKQQPVCGLVYRVNDLELVSADFKDMERETVAPRRLN